MHLKRSFFERISGTVSVPSGRDRSFVDDYDAFDDLPEARDIKRREHPSLAENPDAPIPTKIEGQLPVDVHQTPDDIIIRAFVAGVRPDELNISVSREIVELSGTRAEREHVAEQDYFTRELFWGSFSRTIMLPEEVDVDASAASTKDGLLTIILPKLDKARQTKLRVKAG